MIEIRKYKIFKAIVQHQSVTLDMKSINTFDQGKLICRTRNKIKYKND